MDDHSHKLNPVQGLMLLFLLLAIPVGIYFFQTQNVGETRSSAANSSNEYYVSHVVPRLPAVAPAAVAPVVVTTIAATPTPTKSIADRCNTDCTSDFACGDGMVCTLIEGKGKCRNAQCFGIADCWCYKVEGTPTPTNRCNITCTLDLDCGTSMICTKTADGNKCRNPQCYGVSDCICYSTVTTPTPIIPTPTDYVYPTSAPIRIITEKPIPTPTPTISSILLADLFSSPTPTPFPLTGEMAQPMLTIDPFYNSKKQTNPTLSLSGTSDPDAELDISISPDGVFTTVTADTLGNWQFTIPKKLTNGDKQLTIIARTAKGGQMTKTETFTVVGGFQFPFAAVVFSLLIALGVGGYILYQKKLSTNQPPPPETSPPTTTEGSEVPHASQIPVAEDTGENPSSEEGAGQSGSSSLDTSQNSVPPDQQQKSL